jgi:SNF2 family DNA or RNA helicase
MKPKGVHDRNVSTNTEPVPLPFCELRKTEHPVSGFNDFVKQFLNPIELARTTGKRWTITTKMRLMIADLFNDLPDKIETTEHCPLTKEQASLYRAIVDDLLVQADEATGIGQRGLVLAGITKLSTLIWSLEILNFFSPGTTRPESTKYSADAPTSFCLAGIECSRLD